MSQITAKSCLPDLGFLSKLRVVRGQNSFLQAAVYITADYEANAAANLRNLGLNSLTLVERHGIHITRLRTSTAVDGDGLSTGLCGLGPPAADVAGADLAALLPGTVESDTITDSLRKVVKVVVSAAGNHTLVLSQSTEGPNCGGANFCHASCDGHCWRHNDAEACQHSEIARRINTHTMIHMSSYTYHDT